jgi:pathogenesis-related protein 1
MTPHAMPNWRRIAIFAALALAPSAARAQFTPAEEQTALAVHNQARCAVGTTARPMRPLIWSTALEQTAQTWANTCAFAHNPSRNVGHPYAVGENIYWSSAAADSPAAAVNAWVDDEKPYYDLNSNSCAAGEVCGHYTQVVWSNTREVGCARASCPAVLGYRTMIVCNYGPAGNYYGQRPYETGSVANHACDTDLIFRDGFEF